MKKNRVCTILAKAGHKISGSKDKQALWLIKHYQDKKVDKYKFEILASIQDIIDEDSLIEDLVSIEEERVISLDYDYKRYPLNAQDTRPIKDIDEFKKVRQSLYYVRDLDQRATVDAVDYKFKRAEQKVRKRGSDKSFCARHILRALLQEVQPFKKFDMNYPQIASILREYGVSLSQIKHAKRSRFATNMIQDTVSNRSHIRKILKLLGIQTENNYKEFLEIFLYKKISNEDDVRFLD
ncbi:hypothetical protein L5F50_01260 [Aliarcobacter butzleri]|nr:hypothetical protein [Aliarcobacter butzleri]